MARVKDVLTAIDTADVLTARSPLQEWMRANHDAFAARLANRRADWAVLAKLFTEAGLTNRYGAALEAETARKTWLRVRQQVKEARVKRQVRPLDQQPQPVRQPAKPTEKASSSGTDDIRALLSPGLKLPDPTR